MLFAVSCSEPPRFGDPAGELISSTYGNCPVYKCPPSSSVAKPTSFRAVESSCRSIGALLGGRAFHELDTDFDNAVDGLRITAVEDAQKQPLTLMIEGDELTARDSTGTIRRGNELLDTYLYLVDEASKLSPPPQYYLHLTDVGTTAFRVGDGLAHTYTFSYRRLGDGSGEQSLCTAPRDDAAWMDLAFKAFVFGGDHYDDRAKTVDVRADTRFNIACAGTGFATMHLNRHTTAGSDAGHITTREQRQAMFKMLYADYCGTGRSFTFEDYPIEYENATGWFWKYGIPGGSTYEAIWNENGAVCLDEPRLTGAVEDIVHDIEGACKPPPPCTSLKHPDIGDWAKLGYVLSSNGNDYHACPLPDPVMVP
jgi:hypothetical protein